VNRPVRTLGFVLTRTVLPAGSAERKGPRWGHRAVSRVLRRRLMMIGAFILLGVLATALSAPFLAPRGPFQQSLRARLRPPLAIGAEGSTNLLGTDHLGRDVFSRVVYGGRISLFIGLTAALGASLMGMTFGLVAGYHGGPLGILVGRLADLQLALPLVLLALAVVALVGPSLINVITVFTMTSWPAYARVIRGSVLRVKAVEFVEGARATGAGELRIILRHILPNVLTSVIVLTSFDVARMIQLEAALGFLGVGVPPPTPTWGNMLADGREYIRDAWWVSTFPGIAIMLTAAGINFVGDGLRDILDPRLTE
jgi:peptide/nickel transport system permease protein